MNSFLELAKERYSVRKYKDVPVETEVMAKILEAGRIAPTAGNRQPHRIKVITAAEDLAKVDVCTKCRFGAPAVLLVCYDKTAIWVRPFDGAGSGEVDASIVTTSMMMQAHDLGLGTCWVMYFNAATTSETFELPENIVPVAFLPLGYPADDAEPITKHFERLPLEEILI